MFDGCIGSYGEFRDLLLEIGLWKEGKVDDGIIKIVYTGLRLYSSGSGDAYFASDLLMLKEGVCKCNGYGKK